MPPAQGPTQEWCDQGGAAFSSYKGAKPNGSSCRKAAEQRKTKQK
jgi:hypothetical protein